MEISLPGMSWIIPNVFWLIPLILIGGSLYGIGHIIRPRFKEIKQKEGLPEIKDGFWHLMLPEFFYFWDRIDFHGFKRNVLTDYEKFLRRIKVLSLRTDNFVNKLLEQRQKKTLPKPEFKELNSKGQKEENIYFKTRENNLIAEIAKNPKDKNLYRALGALYLDNKMYSDAKEVFNVILELDPSEEQVKDTLEKIANLM